MTLVTWKSLNSFANSDESLILYETHKHCPIVSSFKESTSLQWHWLQMMAANDINYKTSIENKLIGIAKGLGIEFKTDTTSLRQSQSFREQMKMKQKNRRKM